MIDNDLYAYVLRLLDSFSPQQLADVEEHVRAKRDAQTGVSAIANHARDRNANRICPRCGFSGAHRHGVDARGGQRFLCVEKKGGCGRTFNGLTETPFARMRKPELWGTFLKALASGHRSIDKLHRFGGVGVSKGTLFRWRTVILQALSDPSSKPLQGVIEADETYFRESFKGSRGWKRGSPPAPRLPRRRGKATLRGISWQQVPVIAAIDRSGRKLERAVGYRDDVADALLEGIGNGSILCTDGWSGFRRVVRDSQASHVVVRNPVKQDESSEDRPVTQLDSEGGKLSLARVNALHQDLKTFVNRQAKGVSTRHLQGYLNWTQAVWKPVLRRCHVVLASRAPRQVGKSLHAQRE